MEIEKLVVNAGDGVIGREVCRLAVALGHDVVGISKDGKPPNSEPWTHGVLWVPPDDWKVHLDSAFALVMTDGVEGSVDTSDVHSVLAVQGAAPSVMTASVGAIASYHAITSDTDAFSDNAIIRVEQLAMALLRAALEVHRGVLDHDRLVFLGDAMMIQ